MANIPFAEMLEDSIKTLTDHEAQNAVVCGVLKDGSVMTAFANMVAEDKAIIAWHILSTAMMEVVLANIDTIKAAIDELEEDNA